MKLITISAATLMLSTPIAAQDGDADAGKSLFERQCVTCHIVADAGGEVLAGRNSRTGPNLFGVVGAPPGSRHDFAYSDPLVAYGDTGAVWAGDNMAAFLQNPSGHLRDVLDEPGARSKMAYRLPRPEDAQDIFAFLAQFGPEDAEAEASAPDAEVGDDPSGDSVENGLEDGGAAERTPDVAAGETLYEDTCRSCHGPRAQGMASFPKLAGKDQELLTSRLEQYRDGERVGPNSGLMIPVAKDLSDQDIANVTAFIATSFE